MVSIIKILKGIFPDTHPAVMERIEAIKQPRWSVGGDIDLWNKLRGQINPNTGRINSYRDIRKITTAMGRKTPSLGTLRNYLGEGGGFRRDCAIAGWKVWFEEFGRVTQMFKEETKFLTTKEEWGEFREIYGVYMGFT